MKKALNFTFLSFVPICMHDKHMTLMCGQRFQRGIISMPCRSNDSTVDVHGGCFMKR